MPDRYVTYRSPMTQVVQVLDLAPTQQCDSARLVCTTLDSTSAAAVAIALNTSDAHDVDELLRTIEGLDQALLRLNGDLDFLAVEVFREVLDGARARQKERS